ncbi:DUF1682-domain-containing protein [Laetiporus sulphureus 93-53]|uniref:DUF1682-domain-containing protein n=1 Tax=Laetiporus sulphureus 93-53 TaxID=1314785 RepID=A0A165DS67_9APHY|nr:DUF1682-domain-containing protein [Laetiporus sulphureus 93-53]KZT05520.1 DUF1682-domain-containing protein [Laetiporus sulphureus 93-53]
MSFFPRFLIPPPVDLASHYDGVEYRWKFLTFRPAYFQQEPFFVAVVLVFVAFYFWGKKANETRVNKWYEAHLPLLEAQFSKPTQQGLIRDGNSDWFNYSTGRRAIVSLHTTFTMRPRHDLLQYAYQIGKGLVELDYQVYDAVELDFTFRDADGAVPECVWAIVAKDDMKSIRAKRWDLTITKTTDQPSLPSSLTVMSELADITSNLLKPIGTFNLPGVFSNPAILPYFRSLSLTDQPRTRPSVPLPPSQRTKHLILSLALPQSTNAGATLPLVTAAFQLVDAIAGTGRGANTLRGGLSAQLRPETRVKLKKVREELDKDIREDAVKEKKEEKAEEKAAARKKAAEEKLSRLSAAEQTKALDREKKRALRKTQGRIKMR